MIFTYDDDRSGDLRSCDGPCGNLVRVVALRRRENGWYCVACDSSHPDAPPPCRCRFCRPAAVPAR